MFRGDWHGLLALQFGAGDIWIVAAVCVWSTYTVLLRRRPPELEPTVFLLTTIVAGLIAIFPVYLVELYRGPAAHLTGRGVLALAYVGVLPSLVGYLFWNPAVAEVGPGRAGIFIHLMPIFGTLLAMVFLGESLHGYHAIGVLLILTGIVLATRQDGSARATSP
ncbi:MAG: DMT family transporter [Vicinamibacterales bacterium]